MYVLKPVFKTAQIVSIPSAFTVTSLSLSVLLQVELLKKLPTFATYTPLPPIYSIQFPGSHHTGKTAPERCGHSPFLILLGLPVVCNTDGTTCILPVAFRTSHFPDVPSSVKPRAQVP